MGCFGYFVLKNPLKKRVFCFFYIKLRAICALKSYIRKCDYII